MPKPVRRSAWRLGALCTLVALSVAACSSSGPSGSTTSAAGPRLSPVGENSAAAAAVPAAARAKGTLVVGTSADYAPIEFVAADGHTITGMDADLAAAIGQVLNLKVTMVNATFDALIPGLSAHRYDIVMSGMNDIKDREKVVDFVDYFSAGTSFFERSSGGPAIQTLADLCGHSVAVESGTSEESDADAQSKKCTAAGKKPVDVLVFQDQNAANLALSSSRADVAMADSPVVGYAVAQSHGKFRTVGQTYGTVPDGIALPKGSGLAPALQQALTILIANGTYHRILSKWGTTAGATSAPKLDGAIN